MIRFCLNKSRDLYSAKLLIFERTDINFNAILRVTCCYTNTCAHHQSQFVTVHCLHKNKRYLQQTSLIPGRNPSV